MTDGAGQYALAGVASGSMTVSASATGYQSASRTATVTADSRLDFVLQRTVTSQCVSLTVSATAGGTALTPSSGTAAVDTGLQFNYGDRITVAASGTISIFGSTPSNVNGPNGYNWWPTGISNNSTFLLSDAAAPGGEAALVAGALVGKFEANTPAQGLQFEFVGASKQWNWTMVELGRLKLGVNDIAGVFSDNLGSFVVQVCRQ